MAPSQAKDSRVLFLRIISSLVLGPLALAVVWYGFPAFELLLLVAGLLMAHEWAVLVGGRRYSLLASGLAGAIMLLPLFRLPVATSLLTAFIAGLAMLLIAGRDRVAAWLAGGIIVATVPCIAFAWLRDATHDGAALIFWILAVAWATDIGAYVFGRLIGGPKLAPRISPNKTWAGMIGGLASAIAVGLGLGLAAAALSWIEARPHAALLVLASAGASLVGQAGDLLESAAKRRFGAKDSGHLIPGHGGLLDRLDSLLAIIPSVALVVGLVHPDGML